MTFLSSRLNSVTYGGHKIGLHIQWYDWRSFGLDVVFRDSVDRTLRLHELLFDRHPEDAGRVEGIEAVEGERLRLCLDYLAGLTERFSDDILRGDEAAFQELVRRRDVRALR